MVIVLEQARVGNHQANRSVENAIKNIRGQLRVIGRMVKEDHPAAPWMMSHAASEVNGGLGEDDEWFRGIPPMEGERITKPVAEFGGCVAYAPALPVGKVK